MSWVEPECGCDEPGDNSFYCWTACRCSCHPDVQSARVATPRIVTVTGDINFTIRRSTLGYRMGWPATAPFRLISSWTDRYLYAPPRRQKFWWTMITGGQDGAL